MVITFGNSYSSHRGMHADGLVSLGLLMVVAGIDSAGPDGDERSSSDPSSRGGPTTAPADIIASVDEDATSSSSSFDPDIIFLKKCLAAWDVAGADGRGGAGGGDQASGAPFFLYLLVPTYFDFSF
jgi:hypothetical protein